MFLNKRKKILMQKEIDKIIENYYLFIPISILNEQVNIKGFKNKTIELYKQINILKELKALLKLL